MGLVYGLQFTGCSWASWWRFPLVNENDSHAQAGRLIADAKKPARGGLGCEVVQGLCGLLFGVGCSLQGLQASHNGCGYRVGLFGVCLFWAIVKVAADDLPVVAD